MLEEKVKETEERDLNDLIEEATEEYYASDVRYEMDLDTYLDKHVYEKD